MYVIAMFFKMQRKIHKIKHTKTLITKFLGPGKLFPHAVSELSITQ